MRSRTDYPASLNIVRFTSSALIIVLILSTFPLSGGCPSSEPATVTDTLDLIIADNLVADGVDDQGDVDGEGEDLSAVDVAAATLQNEPVTIMLGVTGGDASEWEFKIVTPPSPETGALSSISRTGPNSAEVIYTPAEDYCGNAAFEYDLIDGIHHSGVATASIIIYPEVRFEVETNAELPTLAVQTYAFTRTGEDLPNGIYNWHFDDQEISGPVETHSARDYVFSNNGSHVISLTLVLAGLTAPIGCSTGNAGSDPYYRYAPGIDDGVLAVTPSAGFESTGDEGGPFTPAGKPYTLSNSGGSLIEWEATQNVDWLSISTPVGELHGGESVTLAISVNEQANLLEPGEYEGRVAFANKTNGAGSTSRDVFLTVNTRADLDEDLTISGRVADVNGIGIADAAVHGLPGPPITDSDGLYSVTVAYGFSGVPVYVEKAGYTFRPGVRVYQNITVDQLDQDYVGTPVILTISGRVTDDSGGGISAAAIKGVPGTPTTDANGYYSIEVEYGYSSDAVWVEKAGYTFTPGSRAYSNLTIDKTSQNYSGSVIMLAISGRVTDVATEAGLAGVLINGLPGPPSTDADGHYTVEVEYGFTGNAVPSKAGYYNFSPPSREYSELHSSQSDQNFTGMLIEGPVVSGVINPVETVGAHPSLGQVTLRFSAANPNDGYFDVTTDVYGVYNGVPVPEGWTGTITAADPGKCILYPEALVITEPIHEPQILTPLTAWLPPLGIPMPDFGIKETHYMYADALYDFGNGPEAYPDAGNGPYTHYVDNNDQNATDSDNPYGRPNQPRLTIPTNLAAGSVVEVHGGTADNPYYRSSGSSWVGWTLNGSSDAPIFVRGIDGGSGKPQLHLEAETLTLRISGQYYIMEQLDLLDVSPVPWNDTDHHVAIRHCATHGKPPAPGGYSLTPRYADDVVYYDNHIYDNGNPLYEDENDIHGIQVGYNTSRIWILDNHIHGNGGDAVQVNSGTATPEEQWARYIYIGRNEMHGDGENAVDLKTCRDVVVSQNDCHTYYPTDFAHSGSDGTVLVVHYDPKDIWFLFNRVHEGINGLRNNGSVQTHVLGNVFYDIHHDPDDAEYDPDSTWQGGHAIISWATTNLYIVDNAIYDCDAGIGYPGGGQGIAVHIKGNIISHLAQPSHHVSILVGDVSDNSSLADCLMYLPDGSARIRWGGSSPMYNIPMFQAAFPGQGGGCLDADPLYVNASNGDFRLQAGSPALGGQAVPDAAYSDFESQYGLDIRCDADGRPRPTAGVWDLGPYQHSGD